MWPFVVDGSKCRVRDCEYNHASRSSAFNGTNIKLAGLPLSFNGDELHMVVGRDAGRGADRQVGRQAERGK